MGFKLYRQETIGFKVTDEDGTYDLEMDVNRLTATEAMQYQLKSSRCQDDLKSDEQEVVVKASMQTFQMQIDLLAEIVTDIRGIDDFSWPESIDERKEILNSSIELLGAAIKAYSDHGKPTGETPKKAKAAVKKKKTT